MSEAARAKMRKKQPKKPEPAVEDATGITEILIGPEQVLVEKQPELPPKPPKPKGQLLTPRFPLSVSIDKIFFPLPKQIWVGNMKVFDGHKDIPIKEFIAQNTNSFRVDLDLTAQFWAWWQEFHKNDIVVPAENG